MEPDFWKQRWREQRIGFHLPEVNPWLKRYWPRLGVPPGSRVFVPLCGKSLDMLWLRDQGYPVLGVELSGLAISSFCEENSLRGQAREEGPFMRHRLAGLELLQGDFFDLQPDDLAEVAGVWDRAALVALPQSLRSRYARKLGRLLGPGTAMLLVTMDYPQQEMQGPPFSVPAQEVEALFQGDFTLELLATEDNLAANPALRERGLSRMLEQAWRLRRL